MTPSRPSSTRPLTTTLGVPDVVVQPPVPSTTLAVAHVIVTARSCESLASVLPTTSRTTKVTSPTADAVDVATDTDAGAEMWPACATPVVIVRTSVASERSPLETTASNAPASALLTLTLSNVATPLVNVTSSVEPSVSAASPPWRVIVSVIKLGPLYEVPTALPTTSTAVTSRSAKFTVASAGYDVDALDRASATGAPGVMVTSNETEVRPFTWKSKVSELVRGDATDGEATTAVPSAVSIPVAISDPPASRETARGVASNAPRATPFASTTVTV